MRAERIYLHVYIYVHVQCSVHVHVLCTKTVHVNDFAWETCLIRPVKKMGKTPKKDKENSEKSEPAEDNEQELTYEDLVQRVAPIANPLASKKLTKKLYKSVKKASKAKTLRRGVKEVQKFIRKGEKGFVVFAGDVTPIEVMCHLPAVCEDRNIPYAYVPAKKDLGAAMGAKRSTCCVLVKTHEDFAELFNDCLQMIKQLPPPI
ncbi:H/ACA ribonucleoprotein complex subunit 2-like protein [Acanthaster planci]|uniref:H/ACA ribonucleoprotein complex subunit 2 n=1 Tax=Acanthaster planci TaxID=133434 RepID=A0A8B7Z0J8_ACAPL|nr:H/ACA ribonucleoprotein complex subunit 2-like protein [Acanthaster planci]